MAPRRKQAARYILPDERIQRHLSKLAELQPRAELPKYCTYTEVSMSLYTPSVCTDETLHSYDLPADVFGPGEPRPTRPKKKAIAKKRNLEDEV